MLEADSPSKTFLGVRFCLHGFDPVNEHKVRVKLIDGGGVGVGRYSQNCTHLIVDKIVYEDPVCVAARNDGKTVVTGLWVDHSFDIGMPVDATSIMYRPLRNLDGIPGAKSLIVCLTGYQRQDRDDIMTMVNLMGAQFSKPLVASKVTHLICYKFEGEKYELAKKIKKIKLINHLWLEDCLREWEILSEANYSKSGYELEVMEAEAKDSDEEAEETTMKHSGQQSLNRSPLILRAGMLSSCELPSKVEVSNSTMPRQSPKTKEGLVTPMKSHLGASFDNDNDPELCAFKHSGLRNVSSIQSVQPVNRSPNSTNMDNNLASTAKKPSLSNQPFTAMSYSRKSPKTATPPSLSREVSGNINGSPQAMKIKGVAEISSSRMQQPEEKSSPCLVRSPCKGSGLCHGEDSAGTLPRKRALELCGSSSKSQKTSHNVKASVKGSAEHGELKSLVSDQPQVKDYSVNETGCLNGIHSSCAGNATAKLLTNLFSTQTMTTENRQNSGAEKSPNIGSTLAGKPDMQVVGETGELPNKQLDAEGGNDKSVTKPVSKKLAKRKRPVSKSDVQNENACEKSPQMSFKGLREATPASTLNIGEYGLELQNKQQGVEVPSLDEKMPGNENAPSPSNLAVLEGGNDESATKPVSKKRAKKTLGSRPKLSNIANRKGSIYSSKIASENHSTIPLDGENERATRKSASEHETCPPTINLISAKDVKEVAKCQISVTNKTQLLDGETQAPDEEDDNDPKRTAEKEKSELVEFSCKEDTFVEVEHVKYDSNVVQHGNQIALDNRTNGTDPEGGVGRAQFMDDETQAPDVEDGNDPRRTSGKDKSKFVELTPKADSFVGVEHARHGSNVAQNASPVASKNGTNGTDPERAVGSRNSEFGEPMLKSDGLKNKAYKRKKQLSGKVLVKADASNSKNDLVGENGSVLKNVEETETEKENFMPHTSAKPKGCTVSSKVEISGAADKSSPVCHEEIAGKSVGKLNSKILRNNENSQKVDSNRKPLQKVLNRVKSEPLCFILSGHRLQRKEFQQVIRRLKGKFCRDSHQWSYQATHFIAQDPIRRTEKFFAAAASGRWILKPDYLSACNQAGKFLAEEPYEWHKNGLSEDGAINLEAPRKWRQLQERTGHGAFYGMRIIVYGECIAPPLDTLKRVVKAGGGDLLATSPPYTRFLKSGIDFAVVSPGMPSVDIWVQEFLKHEVPCVVADYLVEYVCKPGYSLERHVLYNTHEWAEKSFSNMTRRAEEIVEDLTPESNDMPNDTESNDITCQVCGSGERGEVMLICGDNNGSAGCGIGTHIDCCDPPLGAVPEEDWFCPKCSRSSINSTSSRRRKKGASSSKGK